jgi:hypothetical protein
MPGRCRVFPLEINRNTVRFRWEIEPAHEAWAGNGFSIEYENDVDLSLVPRALLWTVFLGATHAIWAMLDGYTVELDEPVADVELAFWNRMVAAVRSASAVPASAPGEFTVRFVSRGAADPTMRLTPARPAGPPAALLSCGKESLLSLGLLREVHGQAEAITIESPMPGSHDHESAFRDWALRSIGRLPGIRVRRIRSDIRATWGKNDHAVKRGGTAYLNELADGPLYSSFALPVAYQHDLSWICLGGEWGDWHVPQATPDGWRFDRYFTLSGPAFTAVSALWQPRYGVGYTSVIQPVSQYLVERILLRRYPDLAAFQQSCFRAEPDVRACQSCEKCFRVTALALAAPADPAILGMDVNRVFSRWNATATQFESGASAAHYESMNHMSRFALASADDSLAGRLFKPHAIDDFLKLKPWRAKRRFHRIRARLGAVPAERLDTLKPKYFEYLPEEFREPIRRIMEEMAPYDGETDADAHAARTSVIAALTEPLSRGTPG